jgi:hypothetical protein
MRISNNNPYVFTPLPDMRSQTLSRMLKHHGSKGGTVRALKLTSDRRKEIAVQAATARWKDKNETKD